MSNNNGASGRVLNFSETWACAVVREKRIKIIIVFRVNNFFIPCGLRGSKILSVSMGIHPEVFIRDIEKAVVGNEDLFECGLYRGFEYTLTVEWL